MKTWPSSAAFRFSLWNWQDFVRQMILLCLGLQWFLYQAVSFAKVAVVWACLKQEHEQATVTVPYEKTLAYFLPLKPPARPASN